ncbi:unnamed protein product [Brassica napus]|uniref:(rape) hypothetical protein n=1 Tax=Brassica napus TaxID=3708 RepID=A0A816KH96_BRANA|nr:unnamed protein product [Brassica napus]
MKFMLTYHVIHHPNPKMCSSTTYPAPRLRGGYAPSYFNKRVVEEYLVN